ncbi:MAG: nitrogen regulation protein NR(I), partial [Halothiobacillaceae bacterium]|nr:nitrogen regulation protein NR(I) [Halothiobacillaceae bacterium]
SDVRMPGTDGLSFMREVKRAHPELPVIIMTAHSDLDSTVSAFEGGAFDYLPKPFDVDEAVELARRACQCRADAFARTDESEPPPTVEAEIIGNAPAMQEVFRAIGRLSRSNITVLINGESGTGKELVARALHRHSPRAERPFIAINTAAIPKDLLESELFGHEKGAFTGAQAQRRGRFEQADGGTLFLDEIGDMPFDLQTRLLRVLADGQFYRVGGHTPVRADVRIIAATHQNLEERVRQGLFREDLFHRLNVIRLHLPSLRERREDIPLLLEHFLKRAAKELGVPSKSLRPEVLDFLSRLDWPGNVRQMENACRWLTVMAPGNEVHMEDLPPELVRVPTEAVETAPVAQWDGLLRRWADQRLAEGAHDLLGEATPVFERVMIEAALERTNGLKQEAAQLLGWGRNTLTRKMKDLAMD